VSAGSSAVVSSPPVDDLANRIIAFIDDYNRRAKPFRWTYDGRPLIAA